VKALIKQTVKKAFTAYPGLKRNIVYHELAYLRDRIYSRPNPAASKHPDLVNALVRDGVVSVEGFMTPEQVKACVDELEPHFERAEKGQHPALYHTNKVYYRLVKTDELSPATNVFYKSELVWDVVRAYMSPRAESYRREAELRNRVIDEVSAEDLFHFDSWHPVVKAFLYLTDVDSNTAPFRYLLGTHRKGSWRRKRDLEFEIDGWSGSFGHFFPGEVEHLQKTYGFQERVFTAKAGTLILGDFRGLHRGTPLRSGRRILLNHTFNIMDWPL
jgi:hypothetical protein